MGLPQGLIVGTGTVIAVKTHGGNYAKVLVTAISGGIGAPGGTITLQFVTYTGAGGGGGGTNPPTISSVTNAAGYVPQSLPGGGIAQGAMFVIKGSSMGPASVAVATSFPLQTAISGTSVNVTVGGKSNSAIMYYTLAGQVAAILPSSTSTGTGTVTVTYNGQTSAPAPITVVSNNFNMFTVNQGGSGDAIAFLNSDNQLITPVHSANAGETVVLWGTGLGGVTGDESRPATQVDMTSVPIEVFIGGKSATVLFRGRNACCSSVDTVYVTVPAGVSGCVVPVLTKIGNTIGNGGSIAVAASGRICTPTTPGTNGIDLTSILGKGTASFGGVNLNRSVVVTPPITVSGTTIPGSTQRTDIGGGTFIKVTIPPGGAGAASLVDVANFGSCTVTFFASGGDSPSSNFTFLDAGPSLALTGPGGPKTLTKTSLGGILAYSGTLDSAGNYLVAGSYSATGTGGPDVGAFTASITLPQPLVWTNQSSVSTVNRAAGQLVTWTGGDPSGYVTISGSATAGTSSANSASASFTCTARTTDQSFTIPPVVLLSLPSTSGAASGGNLSVGATTASVPFKASGLDFASLSGIVTNTNIVTYQ